MDDLLLENDSESIKEAFLHSKSTAKKKEYGRREKERKKNLDGNITIIYFPCIMDCRFPNTCFAPVKVYYNESS